MTNEISDIRAASSAEFLSRAAILVAVKTQDAAKQQGEAALKLMEQSLKIAEAAAAPSNDGHVDVLA